MEETETTFESEAMLGDDMQPQFGQCCACRGSENVRTIVMHDFRAPIAGSGWGCVVCHLPMDGAISVICDHCRECEGPILDVCVGYPKDNQRFAMTALTKMPFGHDLSQHADDFEVRKLRAAQGPPS